mmetsp:Transcript_10558/g.22363  ORF Transcript_10558/g.22363 Transcript_10558/m.22363 type:complete len:370 (+) Transcript_10558:1701-2810(+)
MSELRRWRRQQNGTLLVRHVRRKVPQNELGIHAGSDDRSIQRIDGDAHDGPVVGRSSYHGLPLGLCIQVIEAIPLGFVDVGGHRPALPGLFLEDAHRPAHVASELESLAPASLLLRRQRGRRIPRERSTRKAALQIVLVHHPSDGSHQGKVAAGRNGQRGGVSRSRRPFLHGADVPVRLAQHGARLRPSFGAPDVRHGVIAVDGHQIAPFASARVARGQRRDLRQEQLGPAVPVIAPEQLLGLLFQSRTLAVLLVQVAPRCAEETEGEIAGSAAAEDLAGGGVGPVRDVREDGRGSASAADARVEVPEQSRRRGVPLARTQNPPGVIRRVEDVQHHGVGADARREEEGLAREVFQRRDPTVVDPLHSSE